MAVSIYRPFMVCLNNIYEHIKIRNMKIIKKIIIKV